MALGWRALTSGSQRLGHSRDRCTRSHPATLGSPSSSRGLAIGSQERRLLRYRFRPWCAGPFFRSGECGTVVASVAPRALATPRRRLLIGPRTQASTLSMIPVEHAAWDLDSVSKWRAGDNPSRWRIRRGQRTGEPRFRFPKALPGAPFSAVRSRDLAQPSRYGCLGGGDCAAPCASLMSVLTSWQPLRTTRSVLRPLRRTTAATTSRS
jgi:hypothetical protein